MFKLKKIDKDSIIIFLFFIFLFIDLGGSSYLRGLSLLIILIKIPIILKRLPPIIINPSFLIIFLILPSLSLLIGIASDADINLGIQNIASIILFPLILSFIHQFNPEKSLNQFSNAALTISTITITFWIALYTKLPYALDLSKYLQDGYFGYFGIRKLNNIDVPVVYFKSTLFLIPAFIFFSNKEKNISSIIILFALACANSKTGIVICLLSMLTIQIYRKKIKNVSVFFLFSLFILIFFDFQNLLLNIFDDPNTLDTRVLHFESLIKLINENPYIIFIGQGAGTVFYTTAESSFVNNIELDHLNSIRKFGLIWFIPYLLFLIHIAYTNIKNKNLEIPFMLFLTFIACGTNPLSLTLMFFAFLGICHSYAKYSNHRSE